MAQPTERKSPPRKVKPGSGLEYLYNHPEEARLILGQYGYELEDLDNFVLFNVSDYDIRWAKELLAKGEIPPPKPRPKDGKFTSPAIKPGGYDEYLYNHPEEVRRILLEHGIDPDDDSTWGRGNIGKKTNQSSEENP